MHSTRSHRSAGFTIIELLVVIVIIGLLTTLATTSYLNAQRGARDSARKTKVSTVSLAVETYYRDKQRFPGQSYDGSNTPSYLSETAGCETFDNDTKDFVYAYYPTKISGGTGQEDNCSLRGDKSTVQPGSYKYVAADYKPYPNWIPGLGDYMNPAPVESRYRGADGSETSPVDASSGDPLTNTGTSTQTLFYRKLKGGYAVYARLETPGDKDSSPITTPPHFTDEPKFNNGDNFSVASDNLYIIRK